MVLLFLLVLKLGRWIGMRGNNVRGSPVFYTGYCICMEPEKRDLDHGLTTFNDLMKREVGPDEPGDSEKGSEVHEPTRSLNHSPRYQHIPLSWQLFVSWLSLLLYAR